MKFKLINFTLETPIYSIYFFKEISEKEFYQLCGILRYHCNRDKISWFAVFSLTESKSAKRQTVKTGLRGRPKIEVSGKKVAGHAHISLVGSKTQSANKTAIKIKSWQDYQNKQVLGSIVTVVIMNDSTYYGEGVASSNRFEKIRLKVKKQVSVSVNSLVVPVNPKCRVYGDYNNQLSVTCDDIKVIEDKVVK